MPHSDVSALRADLAGGLVSSALAIPLAIGFGMFAFVALGDEYFAYGAFAGLLSALIAGVVITEFVKQVSAPVGPGRAVLVPSPLEVLEGIRRPRPAARPAHGNSVGRAVPPRAGDETNSAADRGC